MKPRNRTIIVRALAAASLLVALPLAAQHQSHGGHSGPAASAGASTKAYKEANDRMHKDMAVPLTGDADVDFARSMIPHHQGAVDMAKIVLQHGKDPAIRKLAEDVIASQEKEITFMRDWLKKNGK